MLIHLRFLFSYLSDLSQLLQHYQVVAFLVRLFLFHHSLLYRLEAQRVYSDQALGYLWDVYVLGYPSHEAWDFLMLALDYLGSFAQVAVHLNEQRVVDAVISLRSQHAQQI